MLAIDPKNNLLPNITSILESLTLLVSTCLTCDIIPKSFRKLCDKLEESLSHKVCTNQMDYIYQQTLLTKINSIKQAIVFTTFDLFKVNKILLFHVLL